MRDMEVLFNSTPEEREKCPILMFLETLDD